MTTFSLSPTPQASVSSSQRKALDWVTSEVFLAPALTIYWDLVTDPILPISTCISHHPAAKLINNFTACKEQPLTVIGPKPKRKKIQPRSLYIAHVFAEGRWHWTTTLESPLLSRCGP